MAGARSFDCQGDHVDGQIKAQYFHAGILCDVKTAASNSTTDVKKRHAWLQLQLFFQNVFGYHDDAIADISRRTFFRTWRSFFSCTIYHPGPFGNHVLERLRPVQVN